MILLWVILASALYEFWNMSGEERTNTVLMILFCAVVLLFFAWQSEKQNNRSSRNRNDWRNRND